MSLEQLEYIKKWCLQDQSSLTARGVADAVVRMIDDILPDRAAELPLERTSGTCPSCGLMYAVMVDGTKVCDCNAEQVLGHV